MPHADSQQLQSLLDQITDPHTGEAITANKAVRSLTVEAGAVKLELTLGYPAISWHDTLKQEISQKLSQAEGVKSVDITLTTAIISHAVQGSIKPLPGVKNIIAVASGKGGVGKSTVSANLALALSEEGANVGILDADIYGPSQPRMFGLSGQPESNGKKLTPKINYGVQTMSIGYLIEEETPMIWRGPMVTQALEQLLRDTEWQDLDYLIIDLPPGTGDTQLTLAQKVPVSGSVIVTTPQDIALLDARKAVKMFEKVEIPILGVVENMSTHVCSECGHEEHIFGSGGGSTMAKDYNVDFLGDIPLSRSIRENADNGKPTVASDPDGELAARYKSVARLTAAKLSTRKKDLSAGFPSIVIQQN